ncbi:chemotaxis protein CheC [Candidatus Kuenenbacteria bacterium]|nr:chemotaxis protein CheC [Candidatus Kuenenbacteria bacterium]
MPQITKQQLASLEKVARKSAERASEALSKLIGIPTRLEITRARVVEIEHLADILATPQESVSAVLLPVSGNNKMGASALISSIKETRRLAELVTKQPNKSLTKLDNLAISAITETANIIGGSFLSILSDITGISIIQSVPSLLTDTMQKIVDAMVIKLHKEDSKFSIALEIDFSLSVTTTTTTEAIITYYVFILDTLFAQKLLETLK